MQQIHRRRLVPVDSISTSGPKTSSFRLFSFKLNKTRKIIFAGAAITISVFLISFFYFEKKEIEEIKVPEIASQNSVSPIISSLDEIASPSIDSLIVSEPKNASDALASINDLIEQPDYPYGWPQHTIIFGQTFQKTEPKFEMPVVDWDILWIKNTYSRYLTQRQNNPGTLSRPFVATAPLRTAPTAPIPGAPNKPASTNTSDLLSEIYSAPSTTRPPEPAKAQTPPPPTSSEPFVSSEWRIQGIDGNTVFLSRTGFSDIIQVPKGTVLRSFGKVTEIFQNEKGFYMKSDNNSLFTPRATNP
jgi:hypothetical protein